MTIIEYVQCAQWTSLTKKEIQSVLAPYANDGLSGDVHCVLEFYIAHTHEPDVVALSKVVLGSLAISESQVTALTVRKIHSDTPGIKITITNEL